MEHELVERLRRAVFAAPAAAGPPEPLRAYARMVRDESHRISDEDVGLLRAAGHHEDEIFEITVGAAVGAALRSLEAGLAAMNQVPTEKEVPGEIEGERS